MEDNSTLPALQDLLEDFDIERLEELAESLLADVTTTMETSNNGSSKAIAKDESTREQLSGSVVGSDESRMEPSEHSYSSVIDFDELPALQGINTNTFETIVDNGDCKLETESEDTATTHQLIISDEDSDSKMIYSDDEIPVVETNIEIITTDEEEDKEIACLSVDEPLLNLLSPIPSHYENYMCSKSPLTSLASDYGYESHGSPSSIMSSHEFKFDSLDFDFSTDDPWNSSLRELFPSLTL